ncbi:ribosomal RNA small subunit methyltransferase I [Bacillus badius]|uniref:Ribosomal RNA small subunit methyltransferase I n=1 Tax=Bacillus badius TaxID=1455 RepID=A0ABR5API7_BACBA|nr:rRNA small subunit methyltransferase I [Bacillus badius]KIL75744.1 rRNA small subunit methyltransferase I [Bacillus badius]KZO00949.1 rRNA (cytidine-2'-O-)-methyltransferase [Bacillus badius]KZR56717.1 rRNA (cytidine-2'-O-)-methyltransferase [Bacillus badius]OCS88975.1 16S rRNA (cytidine(1402)-2'-O)-methyltransferase [Bacillus badius]
MIDSQKSFIHEGGALYLVPTPIGNLEDMTFRAIRIMKEANVIAAEDTRNTKKLCNYFEIATPITSYHEHNKETSGQQLLERMKQGETVALVSDAGMPSISDPGYELTAAAISQGITVIPLPGANAALTALIASGLAPQPFYFYGFLSRHKKEKKAQLAELNKARSTFILYESPHRLKDTLALMADALGADRKIVLCRELTKKFEEFLRGTIEEALTWSREEEILGEFCLIVEGNEAPEELEEKEWWSSYSIVEHVDHYIHDKQLSSKEAIKQTAVDRSIGKREVYQAYHVE